MKGTTLALVLTALVVSACSSLAEQGPFARLAKGNATQTDVMINDAGEPEVNPFPAQSPFGN
jgi:hypothetical protein